MNDFSSTSPENFPAFQTNRLWMLGLFCFKLPTAS